MWPGLDLLASGEQALPEAVEKRAARGMGG